jgi:putative membrane protein
MKTLSLLLAASLFAVPAIAVADNTSTTKSDSTGKLGDADTSAISELHHANQSEVDLGKYALAHGTKTIKDYATMIVKDHSTNDTKLTALAKKAGMTKIPAPPADKAEMDDMMKLKAMKGADFDRAYISMMITDHEKDIKKVSDAMGSVSNPDLKAHLTDTKPALERHLDSAKTLQQASPQAQK